MRVDAFPQTPVVTGAIPPERQGSFQQQRSGGDTSLHFSISAATPILQASVSDSGHVTRLGQSSSDPLWNIYQTGVEALQCASLLPRQYC